MRNFHLICKALIKKQKSKAKLKKKKERNNKTL